MANSLPLHIQARNRARDYYNPLRRLDMPRLIRLLEEGERGMHGDVQWLYRMIEKRDATVRALKMRRTSALKKLDWDIKLPAKLPRGITKAQAEAQVTYLRETYERIENLPDVFEFLALASFRGFSHLEKRHQDDKPSLPIIRLEPVPQWHWVRDPDTWAWKYDASAESNWAMAVPIEPANFIIRELDDPINEIAAIAFLRKNMSQKDWDSFVEDFGIPSIFALLGVNTPPDKVKEWLAIMEKVTGNSRGALPPGSDVKTIAHGSQGETPFKSHKDEQREEVVLAGTGGLLSMLSAPTGLGSDQAKVHEAAFDAIAQAEAMGISALLQTQFDKPLLSVEFPSQPSVAYFELAAQDQDDLDALAERLVKLAQAGLEADENEISEKMGLKLIKKAAAPAPDYGLGRTDPALKPKPFANRETPPEDPALQAEFEASAKADLAAATLKDQAALIQRLAALDAAATDAEWLDLARQLDADWPGLLDQWAKTTNKAEVLAQVFGTSLVDGAVQGARSRAEKPAQNAPKTPEGVSTPVQGAGPA
jgi:phage gp29-like protein